MDIKEKKREIINSVQNTNDELLINEVYDLLHEENNLEDITSDELPQELQIKLSKAVEDYKQGRYITYEQMQQKIQQWLTK